MTESNKDGFQKVGEAAIKAADKINKFAKEADKVLNGEQKKKNVKKIISSIADLRTDRLYVGMDDKLMYRKVKVGIEKLVDSNWVEVVVTAGFLHSMKFREY